MFELIIGFANGVGSGFGIVIACLWGANDREKLKKAVASSLILSLMLSAVLMIVSFVALKPLLILLKTPADILEEAYGYISIICMAVAITMLYNLGAALLRAIGDSITPLIVLLIASVLNIALDFLFMTRFSMGIAGAAVATVIAQGVCCIFCFWFILRRAKVLVPSCKDFSFDSALCRELLEQGFSMGIYALHRFSGNGCPAILYQCTGHSDYRCTHNSPQTVRFADHAICHRSCSNRHLHFPEQGCRAI